MNTPSSADERALPPLPEPVEVLGKYADGIRYRFSPEQMKAYVRADRASLGAAQVPEAWIEHHKAGDNLSWDRPSGKCTPLYLQPAGAAQVPSLDVVSSAIDAFEQRERGLAQAHIAAKLVAEMRAALSQPSQQEQQP